MESSKGVLLPKSFYAVDPLTLAKNLLGKIIIAPGVAGRIVETESYWADSDPASHGHKRQTPRNSVMFGPPGCLYVYFTYGMHYCANVVAGKDGECAAVLLRALEPLEGLEKMRRRRNPGPSSSDPKSNPGNKPKKRTKKTSELCNGPAKLTQAFAVSKRHNGLQVHKRGSKIQIKDDGYPVPKKPGVSKRIGVNEGKDLPWRFYVAESDFLSR